MKIAALSDIHGNLPALEAVLDDIERQGADVIVNLGDILSGPLYPSQTADRLMQLGLPTIRGNHERQLLGADCTRMGPSDRYARGVLSEAHLAWVSALPATLWLESDVLLVHGTPQDDLSYFLETVTADGCRTATHSEVRRRAAEVEASLILCGHTHLARSMQLADGRFIVNPGSVGLPAYEDTHPFAHRMETGTPHARYASVTRSPRGWEVEFRAVEYDWHAAAELAAVNGRPDWETALRTGYC